LDPPRGGVPDSPRAGHVVARTSWRDNHTVCRMRMNWNGCLTLFLSSDTSAFDRSSIDTCFATRFPLNLLVPQDDRMYVAIDPSGGGFSQTACLAACVDAASKCVVVTACDGCAVTCDEELETYIRGFFEMLRCTFPNVTFVAIIERNFGGSVLASRIADLVSCYQPARIVTADSTTHRRVGVVTTDVVKERARVDVQRMLRTETLRFTDRFLSGTNNILEDVRTQLIAYKFVYSERPNGAVKAALSGKGFGRNDDMAMAVMLMAYWSAYVVSTPTSLL